jgi:protein phosphatase
VRSDNEDTFVAEPMVFAVADGMGGHQAGELASRLAVQAALAAFESQAAVPARDMAKKPAERLQDALAAANNAVYQQAQLGTEWRGMGTTLLLLAPTAAGFYVAWVGDSRLYLWRDVCLTPLTRDDTLVQGLLDRGLIAEADVARHPDRSVLTQAVGTHARIPSPHVQGPFALRLGDRFLLCSDGVHDVVPAQELASALRAASPHEALHELHLAALRGGADDNLSIGVVDILARQPEARRPRATRQDVEVLS